MEMLFSGKFHCLHNRATNELPRFLGDVTMDQCRFVRRSMEVLYAFLQRAGDDRALDLTVEVARLDTVDHLEVRLEVYELVKVTLSSATSPQEVYDITADKLSFVSGHSDDRYYQCTTPMDVLTSKDPERISISAYRVMLTQFFADVMVRTLKDHGFVVVEQDADCAAYAILPMPTKVTFAPLDETKVTVAVRQPPRPMF